MELFEALGAKVNDQWRRADYSRERFADIAAATLSQHVDALSVSLEDVFAHVLFSDSVCPQMDSNFG
jgi:hypothetical protein